MLGHRSAFLSFFSLTYAVTWTCFVAAAAISGGTAPIAPSEPALSGTLFLARTFAPSFVALWLTWRAVGNVGLRAMLGRLVEWKVGVRWYVFAVGYMAAIKIALAPVHRIVAGAWPVFGDEAWYVIVAAIVLSTPTQAGEEIGWRGFALPRLEVRFGLARASLLLGVMWACWPLPLFFIPGVGKFGQSLPVYILGGNGALGGDGVALRPCERKSPARHAHALRHQSH